MRPTPYNDEVALSKISPVDQAAMVTVRSFNDNKQLHFIFGQFAKEWLTDTNMAYDDDKMLVQVGVLNKKWLHDKLDEYIERITNDASQSMGV